jgi:hypothetical protein
MLKYCITLFLLVTITFCVASTTGKYDIGNFKPTDLLDYSLSPYINHNSSYQSVKDNGYSFYLNNQIAIYGSLILDKSKFNLSIYSNNNATLGSAKYTYPYYKSNYKETSWSTGYSTKNQIEYRRYTKFLFVGAEYICSNSWSRINNDIDNNHDFGNESHDGKGYALYNKLSGIIGSGRLYQCQEAYLAWYYFKELDKNGCLNRQYNETDINKMASKFYELRSLHEIDYRIRYVKKATILLDELKSQGYVIDSSETKASAILMELWQEGLNADRLVGTRFQAKPFVTFYHDKETNDFDYEYEPYMDEHNFNRFKHDEKGMELVLQNERPYHNIFQLSTKASIKQGWFESLYEEDSSDTLKIKWHSFTHLYGEYTVSCYPDCRSHVSLGINSNYKFNNLYEDQSAKMKTPIKSQFSTAFITDVQKFDLNVKLSAYYLLTYRISINGSITGTFEHQMIKDQPTAQQISLSSYFYISYRLF